MGDLVKGMRDWLGGVHLLRSRLAGRNRTEFFMPGSLAPELMRRSEEMLVETVDLVRQAADRIEALEAALREILERCDPDSETGADRGAVHAVALARAALKQD